jgi:hypothetical protein
MKQLMSNGSTWIPSFTWPNANGSHDRFWNHGRDWAFSSHYNTIGQWIVWCQWRLSDSLIWEYPVAIGITQAEMFAWFDLLNNTPSPPLDAPYIGLNYNRLIRPKTLGKWTPAEIQAWESGP